MAKKKEVKVGQEVQIKCPVCGFHGIQFDEEMAHKKLGTFARLRNTKRVLVWCGQCATDFWFDLSTKKMTVKQIDNDWMESNCQN